MMPCWSTQAGARRASRDIPVWKVDNMTASTAAPMPLWRDKERASRGVRAVRCRDLRRKDSRPMWTRPPRRPRGTCPSAGVRCEQEAAWLRSALPYKTGTFDYDAEKELSGGPVRARRASTAAMGSRSAPCNVLVETDISQIAGDEALRMKAGLTGSGKETALAVGKRRKIQVEHDRNSPFLYAMPNESPLSYSGEGMTLHLHHRS